MTPSDPAFIMQASVQCDSEKPARPESVMSEVMSKTDSFFFCPGLQQKCLLLGLLEDWSWETLVNCRYIIHIFTLGLV